MQEFAGPRSLPLWLADPDWRGFMDRSNARATGLGLVVRPVEETLADALAWERSEGFDRPRKAGITTNEQHDLVRQLLGQARRVHRVIQLSAGRSTGMTPEP